MLAEDFGIKVDCEEQILDDFVSEQNEKFLHLHEWQQQAINFFFNNKCKAIFEVTTGAGKTFCAIEIIKKLLEVDEKIYVLIVVPKNVILEEGWVKELKREFNLRDVGVYYGFAKEVCKFTVTNMQNLSKLELSLFDFVILDEIHNYGTKRLLALLQEHKFKYLLGLSATLERMDGNHWKLLKYFDYNKFDYSPREALVDGVINEFNFYNIGVTMTEEDYEKYNEMTQKITAVLTKGGSFNRIMMGKCTDVTLKPQLLKLLIERKQFVLNYPLKFEVLKNVCAQHLTDKILVFNEYNSQTSKCYWHLLEKGMHARVLHSGVDKKQREEALTDYKNNKFNILLATKILDEGYNLPAIDCAIIQAGNSTARQTIQRMGRVLRKKDKISSLYQIYVKDTMEEKQAVERAILFKELCTDFRDEMYEG